MPPPEQATLTAFAVAPQPAQRVAAPALGSRAELRGIPVVVYEDKLSALLGDFARTLLTDFPIQGILDRLVQRIVDALPVTSVGVTLISPSLGAHCVAGSNPGTLAFELLKAELVMTPSMSAHEAGEPVGVPDINADQRFPEFAAAAQSVGIAAAFSFPLWHNEGRLGVLDLYRDTRTVGPAGHGGSSDDGRRHGRLRHQRPGPRDRTGNLGTHPRHGTDRPADRTGQPPAAAPAPARGRRPGRALGQQCRRAVRGPRPVQADQRHLRPPGGRRAADRGRQPALRSRTA